jgi:hypothetical protein
LIIKPKTYNENDNNYQNNDAIEIYNRLTRGKKYVFETCNWNAVTSACMALVDRDLSFVSPTGKKIDPAMGAWIWINTPENFDKIKKYRKNIKSFNSNLVLTRIPQYFCAAKELFGVEAEFKWNKLFNSCAVEIANGNTLVIQLKKPAHYIMIYGYDTNTKELLCHDPNKKNKNKFKKINEKQFERNVCSWYNVFYKPKKKFKGFFV